VESAQQVAEKASNLNAKCKIQNADTAIPVQVLIVCILNSAFCIAGCVFQQPARRTAYRP
jgi:hypothetical protein